jgi:hypothetical protein
MRTRSAVAIVSVAALWLAPSGCGKAARDVAASHAAIGGDVVARVGDVDLPASLVGGVASDRRITPSEALGLLIDDAVAASVARAQGFDRVPEVQFATTMARARATVDRIKADAWRSPPTDAEIADLSEERWLDVDAPETFAVVHAVARRPSPPDPHVEQAAKAVAQAIAASEVGAVDADDFQTRARAVPHEGVELVVQPLDPFTADGRVAVPGAGGHIDRQFAAAAATLTTPGAMTGVVETEVGWHVIRLVEKHPARLVPKDERRKMFTEEIRARRAHDAVEAVQTRSRAREGVTMANGLDDLLALALPAIRAQASATPAPQDP